MSEVIFQCPEAGGGLDREEQASAQLWQDSLAWCFPSSRLQCQFCILFLEGRKNLHPGNDHNAH